MQKVMRQLSKNIRFSMGIGTLPHLRAKFKHRQVKDDTKKCVNPTSKLISFACESYVTALACKILGLETPTSELQNPPGTKLAWKSLLHEVSSNILEFEWHRTEKDVFQQQYCHCRRTFEQTSVDMKVNPLLNIWKGCENRECNTQWFHEYCVLNQNTLTDDEEMDDQNCSQNDNQPNELSENLLSSSSEEESGNETDDDDDCDGDDEEDEEAGSSDDIPLTSKGRAYKPSRDYEIPCNEPDDEDEEDTSPPLKRKTVW